MRKVTINNGVYYNNEFNGTYEMISSPEEQKESRYGKSHRIFVKYNDKKTGIWVNPEDCSIDKPIPVGNKTYDHDKLVYEINRRFMIMNVMTNGIISGDIRSLIIAGAAGIGKTYTLERKLEAAEKNDDIKYVSVKGKISSIGLYSKLYENRDKKSIIVLDDVDVFNDIDGLNILKAALDSGDKRIISWSTAASYLENNDIPKEFEFEGTIVFITNMDVDRVLKSNTKITPHMNALVSRSVCLDLKVHTNREIMIRVNDVIKNTEMLKKKNLTDEQIDHILEYMNDNVDNLKHVSLRTALHLANFMNTDPEKWVDMADVTQLK